MRTIICVGIRKTSARRAFIVRLFHIPIFKISSYYFELNKKNDKRFNNCDYSLFFLMGIFLKHLWLIPDILKWQNCKIFTNLVPSQNPSRRSHRKCSVKKDILKNLQNLLGKHLKRDWNRGVFQWNYKFSKNTYFEEYLRTTVSDKT